VDGTGALYLTGTVTKDIDFDPGFGTVELTTNPVGVLYNGDVFTVKYATTALPVSLVSFTGEAVGKKVLLKWTTTNEVNNQRFEVQRSTDGLYFSTFTQVDGKGTTSTESNYSAYDAAPMAGINYYRLKQVDADNKFKYSKIININFESELKLGIYPNPVSKILNIAFNGTLYNTVQLIGPDGKILASNKNATGLANFNVEHLPAGTYYVRLTGSGGTVSKPVVKN